MVLPNETFLVIFSSTVVENVPKIIIFNKILLWNFCLSENGNIWKNKKCENSNETIFSDFQILWGYFYLEL